MGLREMRFGDITLETNGFDRDIYEPLFNKRNLPINGDAHPPNWYAGKLKENINYTKTPLDNLKSKAIEEIVQESRTRLTEEDFLRIDQTAMSDQCCRDAQCTYEQTKGFFQDFINAWGFARNLRHLGLHPWSKRIHSDIVVFGKGESSMTSGKGRVYALKPIIAISGLSHDTEFSLTLRLPEQFKKEERAGVHSFVLSHEWSDGSVVEPDYIQVSKNGGPFMPELYQYVLSRKDLDAHAGVGINPEFFYGFELFGKLCNYQAFCEAIINETDTYF